MLKRVILHTQATIAVHNYLSTTESSVQCPPGFIDEDDGSGNKLWRVKV